MYISHESPLCMLEESRQYNDYDYALVHLFEKYPEYYQFFKDSVKLGRQVLLDNSIFELKEAFDSEKFAVYIKELLPSFYIVPDVLEDGYATISKFTDFTEKYTDLPGLKIGAIQGSSYDEIVDCYQFMSVFADYIAISFDFSYYILTGKGKTKLERYCDGRERLIRQLISDGIWNHRKPHHLLGNSLPQEMKRYKDIKSIRSVDTSNPIVSGIKGLRYNGDLGLQTKPSCMLADLIDHDVTDDEIENILYNVNQFKIIANGN